MIDNTEPTIDNILDVLEITVETVAWQEAKQDAKKSIEALIADQVAKARIEETKLYKQYFKGRTQGYANARIDVLEKELATKRSKE